MVKALLRANLYVRANREGTIQTMMDWVKVDRESAVATYDSTVKIFSEDGSISESGLKLVVDQGREAMKIDCPVALSEVADFQRYSRRAKRDGDKEVIWLVRVGVRAVLSESRDVSRGKSPLTPLCQRGEIISNRSPFDKGGYRGICRCDRPNPDAGPARRAPR